MANMELSKYIKSESVELNRSAIHFEKWLLSCCIMTDF